MLSEKLKDNLPKVKKWTQYDVKCPVCGEKMKVGVELGELERIKHFPFTHLMMHGSPLHAVIVYIDKHFQVRGVEGSDSLEFDKKALVFQEVIKKWSNPF
ncbi:MAG: hypothetical protein ACTSRZ_06825 [Promethearchaeota archaeon]